MDSKELKKVLAGVSLAGLIVTGGVVLNGCVSKTSCSSCGSKKSKMEVEEGKTSCSGKEAGSKTSCSDGTSHEGGTSCG